MKKSLIVLVGVLFAMSIMVTDGFTRGGGRGGGGGGRGGGGGGGARAGGGGGGARAGGGYSGGGRAAASPSFNRSPSMSRATPSSAQRPTASRPSMPTGGQRPSAGAGQGFGGNRPSQLPAGGQRPGTGQRPSGGAGQGIAARPGGGASQAGQLGLQSPESYQRPSAGQVSNFLNMPADSARGQFAGAAAGRPSQLPSSGGSFGQTVTGPGGGQVTVGGVGGSRTGPGGTTVGAGRVGMSVTGPGGNTYTRVAGGAAIRGPGGNTVAAGRGASFANGQFVGGRSWSAVNGNFTRWGTFTPGWYGRYPGAWWPGKWAIAGTAWATATWALAGSYCGCTGEGTYYDYDDNVAYQDGTVYYGDQPVASAEQYYDQAEQIAATGQSTENEEWLPLGVFAVIAEPNQTKTDRVVQLAVNKEGVIRGNFQDALADKVMPVVGSVDKKTQRVALKLEGNELLVVETGLYNLTNDEVPVLVHFGPDRQESRTLIRLKQPETEGTEG